VTGRAVILMYHNVGKPREKAVLGSLYVTPRMFRFQMRYLKTAGFKVVPLTEIAKFVRSGGTGDRLVALTFDDGYRDFYENAFPALKENNFPSTVFLVSDLVGKENLWDSADGKGREPLMDWDEILRLKKNGVAFGSHTRSHPFLSKLPVPRIEDEVANSKSHIEERLQIPVESFCYPYGDYDDRVLAAVEKAGYTAAVTIQRGLVRRNDNPLELRRSFIRRGTHPFMFMYKVHSKYEDRKGGRR
jgi:peptidoglycan/xylan/chitin deacetylase (PgdA/CDA1 family)